MAKLKESTRGRTLSADTAARLADYLRPFGAHEVVVSCAPDDIEAYRYATQIADVLKAANWDARGPETTTIFGAVRAMGINVYDDGTQRRRHRQDTARRFREIRRPLSKPGAAQRSAAGKRDGRAVHRRETVAAARWRHQIAAAEPTLR